MIRSGHRYGSCSDCLKDSEIVLTGAFHVIENRKNGVEILFLFLCPKHRANRDIFNSDYLNTFRNWKNVPEHFKTKTQLKELGLKPVTIPVARFYWNLIHNWMLLYDMDEAIKIKKRSQ